MITRYRVDSVECKRNIPPDKIEEYRLDYNIQLGERKINEKERVLEIPYSFTISYLEGIGHIRVDGEIYYSDTLKKLKDIDENWNEKKKIQKQVVNTIFRNILAMIFDISKHMGLPSPVVLPSFGPEEGG
ncbi:MAG: hypothetical protein ACE5PM_00530 [Candidatus Hydrothermarchaeales archaeon]